MNIDTNVKSSDKIIILVTILVFLLFIVVDVVRVHVNEKPIFSIYTGAHMDGTEEYIGFGYKIINYKNKDGNMYKLGTWFMNYDYDKVFNKQ